MAGLGLKAIVIVGLESEKLSNAAKQLRERHPNCMVCAQICDIANSDAVQAMATAALRLMEEPGLATALTTQGFIECTRYQGPQVAQQWVKLYNELVSTAK